MTAPYARSVAAAYRSLDLETMAQSADPHRLIEMLYDGAIVSIGKARIALSRDDAAAKGMQTTKAIRIIGEGLRAALDVRTGGELAARLDALYDYMGRALLQANLDGDDRRYAEVEQLLGDLRGAWRQIRPTAPAPTTTGVAVAA